MAVALVAVAALVVAEHLPHGTAAGNSRGGAGHRSSATGLASRQRAWPSCDQLPFRDRRRDRKVARAGLRLPRAGPRPAWYLPAKGTIEPIGGLPVAPAGYTFTKLESGWAIQPQASAQGSCAGCPGKALPVYYLASHAPAAARVGSATMVAPGTRGLWLTSFPAGSSLGARAGTARQYSSAGVPEGPAVKLPVGFAIARGRRPECC